MAKKMFFSVNGPLITLTASCIFISAGTANAEFPSHLFSDGVRANVSSFTCPSNELRSVASGQIRLADFSQPMDTLSGKYDILRNDTKSCLRKCDGVPRLCYYEFNAVPYAAMSPACGRCPQVKSDCYLPQCVAADGFPRGISTYNRMLPGPAIQVCEGDTVVVDVINDLPSESTTIHWHGIRQWGSQYYDGVPYVTQCPIGPGNIFRYQFRAEEAGSYFYHSHAGLQKLDGLSGPLIVRENPRRVHNFRYDEDRPSHIVYIQDWMHILARDRFPGRRIPSSYLVNGRGIYIGSDRNINEIAAQVGSTNQPPVTIFNVTPHKTYRLRVISGTCIVCPVIFYIQGHNFTVVAGDGGIDVIPKTASMMSLNSGERFDILVNTTNIVGTYWIVLQGAGDCAVAKQLAILRYEGAPEIPPNNSPISPPGTVYLNPFNSFCNASTPDDVCISDLKTNEMPPVGQPRPLGRMIIDIQFGFHFYTISELFQEGTYQPYFIVLNNTLLRGSINNISYVAPPSPLISQYSSIPRDRFCSSSTCPSGDCRCTNVIKIPKNYDVTILILDSDEYSPDGVSHPFHLHGFNFFVLEMGVFNTSIDVGRKILRRRVERGLINNPDAPMKDTISIPSGGYAVVKFFADNPGFWLLHCHFLFHLDTGMALVFQVGEFSDLPPVPPGFPKCGDFIPLAECRPSSY